MLLDYFGKLPPGKAVLWCYLIWYLVTVVFYFDPSPSLWLNSIGISAIIGIALLLSVAGGGAGKRDPWQTLRLFMMPFCVSSFSALIKGKGYILIVPPEPVVAGISVGACAVFLLIVFMLKQLQKRL